MLASEAASSRRRACPVFTVSRVVARLPAVSISSEIPHVHATLPAFFLVLGLVQAGHEKGKEKPKEAPKPSPDADLVAFAKDLDAGGKDKIADIVHAFAQKHGAKDKAVTMTSADKKVHVVIGAPGSEKSPNAADV